MFDLIAFENFRFRPSIRKRLLGVKKKDSTMGTVFEKLCFQKYPNTSGQATLLFSGEIDAS